MDIKLDFDIDKFMRMVEKSPDAILRGAKRGMHDALDDWQSAAVDIAPLDKGTLRRSIAQEPIQVSGDSIVGVITANAIEVSRSGRFNYAYYIHEKDAGGKILRHPGTVKKFLDVSLKKNEKKYLDHIEKEIKTEMEREGW